MPNNDNYYYSSGDTQDMDMNDPDGMQMAVQFAQRFLGDELTNDSPDFVVAQRGDQASEILQIFLTRRQDVLQLIEAYGVPRRISRVLTTRIIQFVLNNAPQVSGTIEQRTQELFRRFIARDNIVVPILRVFGVPFSTIYQYIREVIRVTLRNIVTIPPVPDINARVREILRAFETQFPNFLGLTSVYNIPIGIARNIVSDIIRFTLVNINRIPQTGTVQERADAMLRLLDRERPDLIRAMINRGVPAGQAESITRQIIEFTLRRA